MLECADCEAGSYSVNGTSFNAERGMAHELSTFEESKSLGSSVDGIGQTLRAIDPALDCRPHGPCDHLRLHTCSVPAAVAHRWTTMVAGRLPGGGLPWVELPTKVRALTWRRTGLHAPRHPALERDSERILLRDLSVIAPFARS